LVYYLYSHKHYIYVLCTHTWSVQCEQLENIRNNFNNMRDGQLRRCHILWRRNDCKWCITGLSRQWRHTAAAAAAAVSSQLQSVIIRHGKWCRESASSIQIVRLCKSSWRLCALGNLCMKTQSSRYYMCAWHVWITWDCVSVHRTCMQQTIYMGKPSAVGQPVTDQPTRPTQPFILAGSINE